MNKAKAQEFFAALQRLMKRYRVSSIETVDGRVIFHDEYGRRACSFEGLDLSGETLDECLSDPSYRSLT
jgi:hypothetical protein